MNEFVSNPTEVVKVGEPLPNSDEINKALEKGEMYKRGFDDAMRRFKRPKGKWVLNCKRYYCSECGEDAIDLESEPDVFASNYCLTNYCPNCGADMRGEEK